MGDAADSMSDKAEGMAESMADKLK